MARTPDPRAERLLRLLGLGYRARQVVVGVEQVRSALKAGKVACVVVAADVSPRAEEKVVRLAAGRGVPLLPGPSAEAIGARLGRPGVMVAGVLDRALAHGLADASRGDAPLEA
ncbi:MAG TPA: ribosomal L7Ae/L30e/S12e/Gadd45 family protein [Gemmatimonadales bacterium]|nr:ribosomal L7Ae/L30e/S12e/Gadd45 family protein [Gemmatimonadales bacterium]